MKVLLSWVAYNNDFQKEDRNIPSLEGPNYAFHKYHWNNDSVPYAKHIILYSSKAEENRMEFLLSKIKRDFPDHNTESRLLHIEDVIDLQEIKSKIEKLLLEHRRDSIDIFISSGTPTMQVAWYLSHFSLNLKTRLFQTRPPSKAKSKQSELVPISMDKSTIPYSITLLEQNIIKQGKPMVDGTPSLDIDQPLITPSLENIFNLAEKVAKTDVTVLILGGTGTGKEVLAQHIHRNSNRRSKSLITFNCSAFQDNILESRLFGHKKGSFTGAIGDSKGIFKEADGGTLFLDEIGDISPAIQQSLLRVLQNGEIQPLGGKVETVDVRIIAATQDLYSKCEEGKFRWDLYYRLAVAEFELPDLHSRGKEEKDLLINYFIEKTRHEFGLSKPIQLTQEARTTLLEYPFHGNIRELENLISRVYAFYYDKGIVDSKDLPKRVLHQREEFSPVANAERMEIIKLLKQFNGNQKKARVAMGIKHNATFTSKLKKYDIDPKSFKD